MGVGFTRPSPFPVLTSRLLVGNTVDDEFSPGACWVDMWARQKASGQNPTTDDNTPTKSQTPNHHPTQHGCVVRMGGGLCDWCD